ncbi:hypothetical protein AVEN_87778-1, partial [Araneus ventricosus]
MPMCPNCNSGMSVFHIRFECPVFTAHRLQQWRIQDFGLEEGL